MQRKVSGTKMFSEIIPDAFVAVVPDHVSLREFFEDAGENCHCLERFVHKELVYFTGKVHEHKMARLKIRRREGFQLEVRDSNVLVLSIKAKADLNLEEALQIVLMSDLKDHLHMIELVAVIPAGVRSKRSATISHAYVQFVDNDSAKACINVVDAMEYKGYRVHSPQLDAAVLVKCDLGASIWHNPSFAHSPTTPPEAAAVPAVQPIPAPLSAIAPLSAPSASDSASTVSSPSARSSVSLFMGNGVGFMQQVPQVQQLQQVHVHPVQQVQQVQVLPAQGHVMSPVQHSLGFQPASQTIVAPVQQVQTVHHMHHQVQPVQQMVGVPPAASYYVPTMVPVMVVPQRQSFTYVTQLPTQ